MPTATMEDYLKSIYVIQSANNGGRVTTSAVAAYLDVTPPTATSMFATLADEELVEYEKYKGALLTNAGERIALRVIRNHRLIESYLTTELGYRMSEVHDEADRLEHHISDHFADCLADALDEPATDPHGAPIPTASLEMEVFRQGDALRTFDEGSTVVVREVIDRDTDVLEYLSSHRIAPGAILTIVEIAPIGILTVRHSDADDTVSLPEEVAELVRVTRWSDSGPGN